MKPKILLFYTLLASLSLLVGIFYSDKLIFYNKYFLYEKFIFISKNNSGFFLVNIYRNEPIGSKLTPSVYLYGCEA